MKVVDPLYAAELWTDGFWGRDGLRFFSKALQEYAEQEVIVNVGNGERVWVRGVYVE